MYPRELQCPQCGNWMLRFGPTEGEVFMFVCPFGQVVTFVHLENPLRISLQPGGYYEQEVARFKKASEKGKAQ